MKLKLTSLVFIAALLSLFVSVNLLLAQKPTSKPRLSEDGSIVEKPAGSIVLSNAINPDLNKQSFNSSNAASLAEIVTITEYNLPISPTNLLINQAGDIWFSSFRGNAIGKLDVTNEKISVYSRQNDDGNVWGVKQTSAGTVWYTTVNADPNDIVGKFEPSMNMFFEWSISGSYANLGLETDSATGDVWFASRGDVAGIYRLSPATNNITAWSTTPFTDTYDLDIDADGNIWFTVQPEGNQGVVRLNPNNDQMTVWEMPVAGSRPFRLVALSSNEIWFTEIATITNSIAQLMPSTNTLNEFRIPVSDSLPTDLLKDGNKLSFGLSGANSVGQLNVSSGFPTKTVLSPIALLATRTRSSIMPSNYAASILTTPATLMTKSVFNTGFSAFTIFTLPTDGGRPFGVTLESSTKNIWFTVGELNPALASEVRYIGKLTVGDGEMFTVYIPVVLK